MPRTSLLAFSCALVFLLTGCAAAPNVSSALPAPVDAPENASSDVLTATFFSCGDADSTLIQAGGYTVLIDTATNKEGKNVVRRMQELGVSTVDLLIISHAHKDHIGGADLVLEAFDVREVLIGPLEIESKQVDQFEEALSQKGLTARVPYAGETLSLGEMQIEIIGPVRSAYEDENDLSLVFRLTWGETAFLFPGDAEKPALGDLLLSGANLRADVLKVPHHGKGEDNSTLFFQAVAPAVAVVPCQRGTEDQLPDQTRVVAPLERLGAQVLVTHDGEIRVQSDGRTVTAFQ